MRAPQIFRLRFVRSIAVVALLAFGGRAEAAYLTAAYESKLESWLGEGDQAFTNIFTSSLGDGKISNNFHLTADGRGRTFSLIRIVSIRDAYGNLVAPVDQIIGGYNPQSWESSYSYHYTFSDSERTAFLFNLTSDILLRQKLSTDPLFAVGGYYQTYNDQYYGPTFGGGHDIYVNQSLNYGYSYQYSYGNGFPGGNSVLGGSYPDRVTFDIAGIEVYTFAAAPASAVPAPAGLVLAGMGLGSLGVFGGLTRLRRRPAVPTP